MRDAEEQNAAEAGGRGGGGFVARNRPARGAAAAGSAPAVAGIQQEIADAAGSRN